MWALTMSRRFWRQASGIHVAPRLLIDIGTNTEVTLVCKGHHFSCSCASGPAFEGAHIRDGMRAAFGAIERVKIIDDHVHIQTIGGGAPIGICGSGILDAVATMTEFGLIGQHGAFQYDRPLLDKVDKENSSTCARAC